MNQQINPICKCDYPDPDVIRVGDTYYMASTTMHFLPGGAMLRSFDLVNWELIGYIFDELDQTPAERMEREFVNYSGGMWAPCLRYHNGKFYVFFVSHGVHKTFMFTAEHAEGPWERHEIAGGEYHDLSVLFDDDGRIYMIYGNREIKLIELDETLTGPKKGGLSRVLVKDTCEGLGFEGSHLYKIRGKYYVFLIDWPKGSVRTENCFVADSIEGEFVGGPVMADDAGFFGNGVAQGGIVDTPNGKWYGILFRDNGAVGRIPMLVPVTWKDDFPVFGNDGKLPEKLSVSSSRPYYQYKPLYVSDDFVAESEEECHNLALPWQWNHKSKPELWSLLPEGGLKITSDKISVNVTHAVNCLTQRMMWPSAQAEVTVDATGISDGDVAGICALQSCYGLLGITKEGGVYYLVKMIRTPDRLKNSGGIGDYLPGQVVNKVRLDKPVVTLCLKADFENLKDELDFFYLRETPKKVMVRDKNTPQVEVNWETVRSMVKVGDSHKLQFRLDHFCGARFGLFLYSTREVGGSAIFKNFKYEVD